MPESTDPFLLELRSALADTYEIEAPIGRGGMGHVFLARERRLDRRVAIKVLPPDLATNETRRRQFLSEARTVAALTHPNIVPIFAVDEIGDFVFFAMAFVAGETLSQRVATRGPLDPHQAARLLCDIGAALGYAHAHGVVHRDVKPDNILLDAATGRAVLSDFGIAHTSPAPAPAARARLGRPSAPRSGRVVGTAAFVSPEQARGDAVDGRSDLYSLGVVAFYALSGRLPFHATTDDGFLALHIAEPAPPLATVAPFMPPRLAQIVDRCLAKDAWARFADASALVRAVQDAVDAPPVPLAIRAFLVSGAHLEGPALLLLVPLAVLLLRVRRLRGAGHSRAELVAALEARQSRRREELVFVYGVRPVGLERAVAWLARVALLVTLTAVAGVLELIAVPLSLLPLLPVIAVAGAATALLAAVVARARTEQRTDPRGQRRLRFWRGAPGRWLFGLAGGAGRAFKPITRIVTILSNSETPA